MNNKRKYKLRKVNVPEQFFLQFLKPIPAGVSTVVDKLQNISPTARGRGQTRVVENITEDEWNDLYQRAAAARKNIRGADRETELLPGISARAMADRMENLGVADLVLYEIKSHPKVVKTSVDADDDIDNDISTDQEPITLEPAEKVPEVGDTELARFMEDVSQGNY